MMKPLLIGAAVAACACASAEAQEQRYQGTLFVTTASAGCAGSGGDGGVGVGENFVFAYRSDDTGNGFALFQTRSAYLVTPKGTPRFAASGAYDGRKIGAGAGFSNQAGTYSAFSIAPATPVAATQQILVRGTLTNFDKVGCTIKFTASAARRPGF
jgi:hypothetical protein